ncbi:MAG: hypothetical protein WCD35_00925 [Mycobacteriales bacterium]
MSGMRRTPLWRSLTSATAGLVVLLAARPLDDPDLWWHVRAGEQTLTEHALPHSETWSWTSQGRPWVPTSWASDVALGLAHRVAGWDGVRVLTVLVAGLFCWLLARCVSAGRSPEAAAAGFALVAVVCAGYLRERPQAVSLVLCTWLAVRCHAQLEGRTVGVPGVVAMTWLWANLHGMWVLAPVALLASGVLGHRPRRAVALTLAALVSAAVTPVGPHLLGQPFVIADRAQAIAEWAPVRPLSWQAGELVLMLTVLVAGWWKGLPGNALVFGAATLLVAVTAARFVAPAAVLLAPLLADALHRLLPDTGQTAPWLLPRLALAAGVGAAMVMLLAGPSISGSVPVALTNRLSQHPGARVLVDYDVGGVVVGLAPDVRAAVDGRTEVYDPAFLQRYLSMTEGRGAWRDTLAALTPTAALVEARGPVAGWLLDHGWTEDARSGRWALLFPKASS